MRSAKVHDLEDLGWNDMGEAPAGLRDAHQAAVTNHSAIVCRAKTRSAGAVPLTDDASVHPSDPASRSFTLRLDASRHLNLRLAAIVTNQSGQKLVIEALDRFL
jgi:hypothetical protein